MSRFFAVVLLVVSFAACDRQNTPSSPSDAAGASPTVTGPALPAGPGSPRETARCRFTC